MLGVAILGERLRRGQAVAFVIAAIGVTYLAVTDGVILWIGLVLALSFGLYGLLRKIAVLGALEGLSLEMGILWLPAVGYLLFLEGGNAGTFLHTDTFTNLMLLSTSFVTAIPLLMFAYGAQRVKLITLGLLQYLAPSLQFIVGIWLYNEPLTSNRLIGFGIIWVALGIYALENVRYMSQIPQSRIS